MTTNRMFQSHAVARIARSWQVLPLVAALAFGLAGPRAQAAGTDDVQGHHGMAAQCGHQMMDKGMGAMHAAHLAALKRQLKLSPEQDAAWAQWVDAVKLMDAKGHPDMKRSTGRR